ncbi:PREDICTED: protein BIG GRAIN 1-like A [Nelumbo nucifera]|uniref:Protein BIG GRAIN 1-like A n=2 Tax=Nelumbo nucifera TaxID=4432 RepID=A0A1U8AII3_NELNU|nr:PREDICTED: protein BIG GRAIN 1-like A [Nelumbo nucifera]DAD44317.1 TPA_asm: hypothetical protein HUJ06_002547 [Nelumbo nucifera]
MDSWEKSLRDDRFLRQERKNPSFSSTLLDAIYRSIDEGDGEGEQELVLYRESMGRKQSCTSSGLKGRSFLEMDSLRRGCMIEKWMDKKVSEKVVFRRKSTPEFDLKLQNDRNSTLLNSTSCSSDSSSGGGFSSSEAESVYGVRSRSSGFTAQKSKPVRTCIPVRSEKPLHYYDHELEIKLHAFEETHRRHHLEKDSVPQQKPSKNEGGRFIKTKSRALKLYGDLKKVKQPISPGGRLAMFLNSLFTSGNAKKAKISSSVGGGEDTCSERNSKSAQASTCSSASSFSRSCLSKSPSSRGKLSNGLKRSVRFYPVSVIVDEDCRPCGHKCLYEDDPGLIVRPIAEPRLMNEELKFHLMEKNRRVEEAARDLLKSYQKKSDFEMRDANVDVRDDDDEEEDDDDDAASYSSSDLFELENLAVIGIDRYREELPVYETTHLDTNRAIASGLIL